MLLSDRVLKQGRDEPSAVHLLGVRIDCLRLPELLGSVAQSVRQHRRQTILYVNAHCINVQYRDHVYRDILADADIVYCDGAGVVLAAHLTGQTIPERMTGADWIEDLCRTALEHDLSLYLLGAVPEAVHGAASALRRRYLLGNPRFFWRVLSTHAAPLRHPSRVSGRPIQPA